jgi:hypothetical protein
MVRPFSHPDFKRNQARCGDRIPCVVCGKPINDQTKAKNIRVGAGGSEFLPPDAPVEPGDMGCFPIGNECLRKNPELKGWAT